MPFSYQKSGLSILKGETVNALDDIVNAMC
jgi:hypothetical protein